MKQTSLLFLLTGLLAGFFNFAQAQNDRTFTFGANVTPALSFMNTNDPRITGGGANLAFGINVEGQYYFESANRNAGLIAGLGIHFGQGGTLDHDYQALLWGKSEVEDVSTDTLSMPSIKYGIQYVEVPIGFRMRTNYNETIGMRFFASLPTFTFGIPTQARGTIKSAEDVDNQDIIDVKQTVNKDITPLMLWWGLGIGGEYYLQENTAFVAEIGFRSSIIDPIKNKSTQVYDADDVEWIQEDSKAFIRNIYLKLGVNF